MSKTAPTTPPPTIRELVASEVPDFVDHVREVGSQSGVDGTPVFQPYNRNEGFPIEATIARNLDRLSKPLTECEWRRFFGLYDKGALIGHADVSGHGINTEMHRCTLGMGLLRHVTGRGYGERVLRHVIDWTVAQDQLRWLDLGVFGENLAAQSLYLKLGFVETGRVDERFIVDGQPVMDITMTLYVGPDSA